MRMADRLSLSVSSEVVARAKRVAHARQTSVSALVEGFLRELVEEEGDPVVRELHAELRARGVDGASGLEDSDLEALREAHVARKYPVTPEEVGPSGSRDTGAEGSCQ